MDDSIIQDVSDTAFMVAAYRAIESERADALFHDPVARKLAGSHGENIVRNLPRWARFGQWFVAIRTVIIDELIEAAIAQGADTIINLGAGLDSRPYRMALPKTLRWIEVDYPMMIELKEQRLLGDKPRCHLEHVKLDLTGRPARQKLFAEIAGKSKKVLVLTEGVVPYLSTEEAASLADDLRAHGAFQYWIVDYLSDEARRFRHRNVKSLKMQNAPFRFEPEDYFAFFSSHGWQAGEIRYLAEEAKRLNRPFRMPLLFAYWLRLKGLLSRRDGGGAVLKFAAYLVLTPV